MEARKGANGARDPAVCEARYWEAAAERWAREQVVLVTAWEFRRVRKRTMAGLVGDIIGRRKVLRISRFVCR